MIACGLGPLGVIAVVCATALVTLVYASWNAARIELRRDIERERRFRSYYEGRDR